jgi:hypothetical protein
LEYPVRNGLDSILFRFLAPRCSKGVISAVSVVQTWVKHIPPPPPPKDKDSKSRASCLPLGFDRLVEARPRMATLILLKGTAMDLELPSSGTLRSLLVVTWDDRHGKVVYDLLPVVLPMLVS